MRIISLNVDGIHQAAQRGLYDWLQEQDADIVCLQDLRAQEYELDNDTFHPEGYHSYFFDSGIPHTNGVAIYTRHMPKALIYGFGFSSGLDMQGRYLQIDFDRLSIGSFLAPTVEPGNEQQIEQKLGFFEDLQAHLHKISRKRRDFIFCGHWNMARSRDDVQNWQNHEEEDGFKPHEQQWMRQLVEELDYVDAFRRINRDPDEYTHWPSGTVGEGDGWRSDLQIVSDELKHRIEYGAINKNKLFSSHLPLIMDYDIEL